MVIKVPLSWLREYCDIPWSVEELTARLTLAGLEIDAVDSIGGEYENMVIGAVEMAEKHPNADRLSLCTVDIGTETLKIVCGAPNVAAGQRVPVALVGARLPGGMKIKKAKIRGIESRGMICSEAELNLSDEQDGIMVLDPEAPVGQPLKLILADPETVLSIDVGANRPDCLAITGVAREITSMTRGELRMPSSSVQEEGPSIEAEATVVVNTPDDCPRFVGRVIKDIKIGPSPGWMVQRLEAVGLRSINNIVDVTNYVMLELGQPLHAYDLDELAGRGIVVRRAEEDEPFTTLDDQARTLSSEVLMITDHERSIGMAGIMGGLNTEITDGTTSVFLEGACFDAARVRRGSKLLQLQTDASRRFERDMDPELQGYAVSRAAQLMAELGGGLIATGMIDVRAPVSPGHPIKLRTDRVNQVLGTAIHQDEIKDFLDALGFDVRIDTDLEVRPPSFRRDISREVDLIEEIARMYGYDKIEPVMSRPTPPDLNENPNAPHAQRDRQKRWEMEVQSRTRDTLIGAGFIEVVTHSFVHPDMNNLIEPIHQSIILDNPLSPDLSAMRTSLAASMLSVVQWNSNRKVQNIRLFEVGRVFWAKPEGLPDEPVHVSIMTTGKRTHPYWDVTSEKLDFFDIKGMAALVLDRFALDKVENVPYDEAGTLFDKNRSGTLLVNQAPIGVCGAVSQKVLDYYDIREPVWMCQLDCTVLFNMTPGRKTYQALPKYPAVERDLAVVVAEDVTHQMIVSEIQACCGALLESVELFDIYRGEQVVAGKKSMAYALRFRSDDRTLTDNEVSSLQDQVLHRLMKKYQAELRS